MSPGVSLLHQIGALLILLFGSVAIAFLPLSLLHYVYRRKRRILRERELENRSQQQKQNPQNQPMAQAELGNLEMSPSPNKVSRKSIIIGWFGFASGSGHGNGNVHNDWSSEHSQRTLSSRGSSGTNNSLYQHFSEMALTSTMAIPSIILELIRSLDGGLLLAALFLILLPQLRSTFDSFMHVHVHSPKTRTSYPMPLSLSTPSINQTVQLNLSTTTQLPPAILTAARTQEDIHSHQMTAKSVSPVPLVELILCLAFFALHFAEEFAQLCLRYRKYFWACNSSVVYSSSNGTCEFTSLDYRINKTKRFLIDCSRKTSSTVSSAATSSLGTATSRTMANNTTETIDETVKQISDTRETSESKLKQFIVTENVGNKAEQDQTEAKQLASQSPPPNENAQPDQVAQGESEPNSICDNHNLQDSLQLYPPNNPTTTQNDDFEPNSLLSTNSSSSYLPSYYWQHGTTQPFHNQAIPNFSPSHQFFQHHHHQPDSMPYHIQSQQLSPTSSPNQSTKPQPQPVHHQANCIYAHQYCCPCHYHHQQYANYHNLHNHQLSTPSESSSQASAGPSPVFTKIFLPYTTLATSTPALYICEGILIAIQPTASMLWLMLTVILIHKLVTGMMVSFELHEKTTGRQRQLPASTTVLFIVLPVIGYLTVLLLNGYFVLKQKDRQQAAAASSQAHHTTSASASSPSSDSSAYEWPIEMAAIRVILFAVASATLLHLVLLIIQRNLVQFQPQLQFRKHKPTAAAPTTQVYNAPNQMAQHHKPPINSSSSSISISSKLTSSTSTTTLPLPSQQPNCRKASHDHINQQYSPSQHNPASFGLTSGYDPEIVTNPPRYGVLHHFTMYTGFIIVLMAIAFLNMTNLKT